MPCHVHNHPVAHFADFIDAIGKLIAAVLDVNGGVGVLHIAAIDIGNSGHSKFPDRRKEADAFV